MRNRTVVVAASAFLFAGLTLFGAQTALAQVASGVYAWTDVSARTANSAHLPILSGETTPLASLELQAETLDGRGLHAEAVHEHVEELMIVKSGEVSVTLEGVRHRVGPGSVAVLLPGEAHGIETASAAPATVFLYTYVSRDAPDPDRGRAAGGSFVLNWDDVDKRETETGGRRDFFDRATTMFQRFEMHVSTLNEGLTNHAAHTHGAEEFVVIMKSTVAMLIGETYQKATEGDVIFLESLIPHALNNLDEGTTEYFAFQWQ